MPVGPQHSHVVQETAGKIRDLPISDRLADLLESAAVQAGIETVLVYSGGQCAEGTCTKRKGSRRHDLGEAADLQLFVDNRVLDFTIADDRPKVAEFVTQCASLGAEGIGAAKDYMGPRELHIGFGGRAVWGRGGKSAHAPAWLIAAVQEGWAMQEAPSASTPPGAAAMPQGAASLDSDDAEEEALSDRPR